MNMGTYQAFRIGLVAVLLAAIGFLTANATPIQATSPAQTQNFKQTPDSVETFGATAVKLLVNRPQESVSHSSIPPTAQDTCMHCHITGENTNIWTPLARWALFGTAGLVFAFGMVRSATVWRTRAVWTPLTRRAASWVDARYKLAEPLSKALNKPVPRFALKWWYCLGGITAFLFIVQAMTGIMLAFYYKPTPEAAFASIQFIEAEVRFGAAIRMVHHWAANGMVVMCTAHMLRVFIMGAYKAPRELNWIGGILLFVMTLAFGLTGYLLPWDQRAFWATTVASEIAGSMPVIGDLALVFLRVGWEVTALTLSRFYALHVILLPIATIILMGLHFLMVRRQGLAQPL